MKKSATERCAWSPLDGTQLGVMSTQAALQLAEQQNLDLVKIVPAPSRPCAS